MTNNNKVKQRTKYFTSYILYAFLLSSSSIYFSPYINLYLLYSSINNQDLKSIEQSIDFNLLRLNVKEQIKTRIYNSLSSQVPSSPYLSLAPFLIEPIIDISVEKVISLNGIRSLFLYGSLSQSGLPPQISSTEKKSRAQKNVNIEFYYNGLNKFVVTNRYLNNDSKMNFIFTRRKFIHWKLTSVTLPSRLFIEEF